MLSLIPATLFLAAVPAFGQTFNTWRQTNSGYDQEVTDGDVTTSSSEEYYLDLSFDTAETYLGFYVSSDEPYLKDYYVYAYDSSDFSSDSNIVGSVTGASGNLSVVEFFDDNGNAGISADSFSLYMLSADGEDSTTVNEIWPIYPGDTIVFPDGSGTQVPAASATSFWLSWYSTRTQDYDDYYTYSYDYSTTSEALAGPTTGAVSTTTVTLNGGATTAIELQAWPTGYYKPVFRNEDDRNMTDGDVSSGTTVLVTARNVTDYDYDDYDYDSGSYVSDADLVFELNNDPALAGLYVLVSVVDPDNEDAPILSDYHISNSEYSDGEILCTVKGATSGLTVCAFQDSYGYDYEYTDAFTLSLDGVSTGAETANVTILETWPIYYGDEVATDAINFALAKDNQKGSNNKDGSSASATGTGASASGTAAAGGSTSAGVKSWSGLGVAGVVVPAVVGWLFV